MKPRHLFGEHRIRESIRRPADGKIHLAVVVVVGLRWTSEYTRNENYILHLVDDKTENWQRETKKLVGWLVKIKGDERGGNGNDGGGGGPGTYSRN